MDRVERREPGVSADRSFRIGEMLAEHPAALDREAGFGKEKGRPLLIIAGQGEKAPWQKPRIYNNFVVVKIPLSPRALDRGRAIPRRSGRPAPRPA
jgi:hypothetical protein